MIRVMKIMVVLLICWAAAMTARHAHNTEAWQHALMFTIGLPWPSVEAARIAGLVLEGLLTAFLGGAYSTLVVFSTRLPAVAAAAILSVAVFIGAPYGMLPSLLDGESAQFLTGHVTMTVVFFVFGWLIAALVLKVARRKVSSSSQQGNAENGSGPT